jgi:hypothetical protein
MERTALDEARGRVQAVGAPFAAYPRWVDSPARRLRWRTCAAVALNLSARYEHDLRPSPTWGLTATHSLYSAGPPTGEPIPHDIAAVDAALARWAIALGTP